MTTLLCDRYAVGELIGAGGAARVHLAEDRLLGRMVAVKVLDDVVARTADPAGRARFLAEARTAATISHPNLVTVYDAGEHDGELFLVMEYVAGTTLAEVIARRAPMPVPEALSIASQMLAGLAAVHRHGTIHRDIKPANVLVGDGDRVRIADFGIAKRLDEIDAAVTAAGTLIGSPHYLAPEQATGGVLSAATDVYQVGLVLHEMLTGRRHGGGSPADAARTGPADVRALRPEVPAHLAAVIARATDPDPAARFPTADAMRSALLAGDDATRMTLAMPLAAPLAAPPAPPLSLGQGDRRGPGPALAAALFALVLALVLGLVAVAAGDDDAPEQAPASTPATSAPATVVTAPVVTTPPPTTAPPTPAPTEEPEGRGNGNGKGNGKGKPKD